jgi:hypothetical protein
MRNNYLGPKEVTVGYGHDGPIQRIVHLVEIIDGPDYKYVIYAVSENGYYTYSM